MEVELWTNRKIGLKRNYPNQRKDTPNYLKVINEFYQKSININKKII